jgi:hypothetical protein
LLVSFPILKVPFVTGEFVISNLKFEFEVTDFKWYETVNFKEK